MRFILQVSKSRLHPDVRSLYTPMYTACRPGCIRSVHPGVRKVLQRALLELSVLREKGPTFE